MLEKIYKIDSVPARLRRPGACYTSCLVSLSLPYSLCWETVMRPYHLADEFTDMEAERTLLMSLTQNRLLYWDLIDLLTPDLFPTEAATWQHVARAFELEQRPIIPADWSPAANPRATAQRLRDLYQRRLLAAAQERLAQALFDDAKPAAAIATLLEEEALRVQTALRGSDAGHLLWASALLPAVLADAEARRLQREVTGRAVLGVPTGLVHLDNLLGGFNEACTCWRVPPAWAKRRWRCRSRRRRRKTCLS
jgi:hypothetical protein